MVALFLCARPAGSVCFSPLSFLFSAVTPAAHRSHGVAHQIGRTIGTAGASGAGQWMRRRRGQRAQGDKAAAAAAAAAIASVAQRRLSVCSLTAHRCCTVYPFISAPAASLPLQLCPRISTERGTPPSPTTSDMVRDKQRQRRQRSSDPHAIASSRLSRPASRRNNTRYIACVDHR